MGKLADPWNGTASRNELQCFRLHVQPLLLTMVTVLINLTGIISLINLIEVTSFGLKNPEAFRITKFDT